jgi:hypothetical protein
MTKKEFARLKTEPLNILRIKERFALLRIVDIQHTLDQKLVLIQIRIMCAVLLLSRPFVSALHGVSRAPGMCVSTVNVWDIGEKNEQVNYFENSKLHGSFKGVKGNLKKHIQYWKDIGAN